MREWKRGRDRRTERERMKRESVCWRERKSYVHVYCMFKQEESEIG